MEEEENVFAASVPGCIQSDYAKANNFGDVNFGYNVKKFDRIEDYTWIYETELTYDKSDDERLFFVSNGIDYEYVIYLNDNEIYRYEGMFKPINIDLTDMLVEKNLLKVKILPPPKREDAVKNDRMEADRSVKPPVSYGWDWHPRLIVSGIWDDTYLESRKCDYINNLEVSYTLSENYEQAIMNFDFDCSGAAQIQVFDPDGNEIYHGQQRSITVQNPVLWWCNGQGEQALYTYRVYTSSDEKCGATGFRKVELVMNTGTWDEPEYYPKTRSTAPITLRLNGREIFAKGVNWVNPEIFTGEITSQRYEELILLARDAHMNIFRCWGGAFVNKESFFELCDKYGIMVWQEFPLACNDYNGEHYLKVLNEEAAAIIKRVRMHPCHVLWCGGNELFNGWSKMTDQSLALRLLNKLCYELDRDKPFIMTSPLMGMAHGGYLFWDEDSGLDVYEMFNGSKNTAYTEFGIPSIASYDVLKRIIPENELNSPKPGTSWQLHHAFYAWRPDTWMNLEFLKSYFGEDYTLEERINQSKFLQSEGLKYIFEESRRQKPYCSMALSWCFNEPWQLAAGSSIVSYPAVVKKSYYAVKNALRPVLASARIKKGKYKSGELFDAEIWLLNDSNEIVSDIISVFISVDENDVHLIDWNTGNVEPNCNKRGHKVQFILPECENGIFTLKLKSQNGYDSEYKLFIEKKEDEEQTRMLN